MLGCKSPKMTACDAGHAPKVMAAYGEVTIASNDGVCEGLSVQHGSVFSVKLSLFLKMDSCHALLLDRYVTTGDALLSLLNCFHLHDILLE